MVIYFLKIYDKKRKIYNQFHKNIQYFKYEFLKSETIAASKCEGICILRSVLSPSFVNFFSWFS